MHIALVGLIVVGGMFLLAALFLWANDRLADWRHRDRRSAEEVASDSAAFVGRLTQPRWDDVARMTGGLPSPALLDLYSDEQLLTRADFSLRLNSPEGEPIEERVAGFLPADATTLEDPWCEHLPSGSLPFARDLFGDLLFVELTEDARDQPVKHWYHDGGDIEVVASSLSTFLQFCREARATAG
jgi:hypothetical protein